MTRRHAHEPLIVGGGPAGLTAAIYATRAGLSPLVIEPASFGGQISSPDIVDNYPGIDAIGGMELGERMRAQAERLGTDFSYDSIGSIEYDPVSKTFHLHGDEDYEASSVIYAAGASPRKAGFAGEDEFLGRGVSYCATCDGMFYRGKRVFVVGGGNTACEEALYLAGLAEEVTLVVRKDRLRAMASLVDTVMTNPRIVIRYLTTILELRGDADAGMVPPTSLVLSVADGESPRTEELEFDPGSFGVFVAVGREPRSALVNGLVDLDAAGYVLTNESMETSTPGLYCAGDVRSKPLRQVVTAAADGAIAGVSSSGFLARR